MASIVQRGNSFSVVYMEHRGAEKRQKWETYHSHAAALRRKEQLDLVREQEKRKEKYRPGSFGMFLREYVELYGKKHWSYSTYTNYAGLMCNYILPYFGTMQLKEFSPRVIAELYGKLCGELNCTTQLLGSIHKVMHSSFEQAVLWEYIDRNPFHKAALPKAFSAQMPMLSNEDIKELLCACEDPLLRIAVHLAFAGTLRKGEILALTWDDVDFSMGTVRINKSLKRVSADAIEALKGRNIIYRFPPVFDEGRTSVVLKPPKTASSIRTIYLPQYVMDLMWDYKMNQTPCRKGTPDLVLRHWNGRPLQEETLLRLLEKQLLALNLPRVTFHSLRHSSITYKLMLTGGNIKAVQGDSGHAQAEMITERYGHILDMSRVECARSFQKDFYGTL